MSNALQPVALTAEQIEVLNRQLGDMRHNVNNHLAMIIAASELIRLRPDTAARSLDTLSGQPDKIVEEVQKFSRLFEDTLRIPRDEEPS